MSLIQPHQPNPGPRTVTPPARSVWIARRLRRRAVAGAVSLFVAAWLVIAAVLVSGRDAALSTSPATTRKLVSGSTAAAATRKPASESTAAAATRKPASGSTTAATAAKAAKAAPAATSSQNTAAASVSLVTTRQS